MPKNYSVKSIDLSQRGGPLNQTQRFVVINTKPQYQSQENLRLSNNNFYSNNKN